MRSRRTAGVCDTFAVLPAAAQNGFVRTGALPLQFASAISSGWWANPEELFIRCIVSGKGGDYRALGPQGDILYCIRHAASGDTKLWRGTAAFGNLCTSSSQKEK